MSDFKVTEEDPFGSPQALVMHAPSDDEHQLPQLRLDMNEFTETANTTSRSRAGSVDARPRLRASIANETLDFEALAAATVNSYLQDPASTTSKLDASLKSKVASPRPANHSPLLTVEPDIQPQHSPRSAFLATAGIRRDQPGYRRRSTIRVVESEVAAAALPAAVTDVEESRDPTPHQGGGGGVGNIDVAVDDSKFRRRGTAGANRRKGPQKGGGRPRKIVPPLAPDDIISLPNEASVSIPADTDIFEDSPARTRLAMGVGRGEREDLKLQYGVDYSSYPSNYRSLWILPGDNRFRLVCFRLVMSPLFQYFILFCIVVNAAIVAADQPRYPLPAKVLDAFRYIDYALVGLFILEAAMKILSQGLLLHRGSYLRSYWNVLDLLVLGASIAISYGHLNVGGFAVIRLLRVIRPWKAIGQGGQFRRLMNGLSTASPRVLDNGMFFLFILLLFAVTAVYLWTGSLDRRCYIESFDNSTVGANAPLYANITFPAMAFRSSPCGGVNMCGEYAGLKAVGTGEPLPVTCSSHVDIYAKKYMNYNNIGTSIFLLFKVATLESWTDDVMDAVDISGRLASGFFVLLTIIASFFCLNLFLAILTNAYTSVDDKDQIDIDEVQWDLGNSDDQPDSENTNNKYSVDGSHTGGLHGDRNLEAFMRRVYERRAEASSQTRPILIEVDERPVAARARSKMQSSKFDPMGFSDIDPEMMNMAGSVLALRSTRRSIKVGIFYPLDAETIERPPKTIPTKNLHHNSSLLGSKSAFASANFAMSSLPVPLLSQTATRRTIVPDQGITSRSSPPPVNETPEQGAIEAPPFMDALAHHHSDVGVNDTSLPPGKSYEGTFVETVSHDGLLEAIALFERTMGSRRQVAEEDRIAPRANWRVKLGRFVEGTPVCIFIFIITLANVGSVSVDHYGQPDLMTQILYFIRVVSSGIFAVQLLTKTVAFGFTRTFSRYWNVFDLIIILTSFPDVFERQTDQVAPFAMARALRAIRIIRILQGFKTFQAIANTLVEVWRSVALLLLLIVLVLFVYACVGMQIFGLSYENTFLHPNPSNIDFVLEAGTRVLGASPKDNFGSLAEALLLCFIVITGDSWSAKMLVSMEGGPLPEAMGLIYFTTLLFIGKFILVNLFVAIIIGKVTEKIEDIAMDEELMPPLLLSPVETPDFTDSTHRALASALSGNPIGGTSRRWDELLDGLGIAGAKRAGDEAGTVLSDEEIANRRQRRELAAQERAKLRVLFQSELYSATPYDGAVVDMAVERDVLSSLPPPLATTPSTPKRFKQQQQQQHDDADQDAPGGLITSSASKKGSSTNRFADEKSDTSKIGWCEALYEYLSINSNYQIREDSLFIFCPQSSFRRLLVFVLGSKVFDILITATVVASMVFLCLEARGNSEEMNDLLSRASYVFTSIFVVEMIMKIIAFGFIFPAPADFSDMSPVGVVAVESVSSPPAVVLFTPQRIRAGSAATNTRNAADNDNTHPLTTEVPSAGPERNRQLFKAMRSVLRANRADLTAVESNGGYSPTNGESRWRDVVAQSRRAGATAVGEDVQNRGAQRDPVDMSVTDAAGVAAAAAYEWFEPGYLRTPWNWVDFIINGLAITAVFFPIFRVSRALRTVRLIVRVDRTRVVLESLLRSTPQLLQGVAFGAIVFFVLGVMGVQLYKGQFYSCNDPSIRTQKACVGGYDSTTHGVILSSSVLEYNATRKWVRNPFHFDHLGASVLSLFVVAVGEHWSQIMFLAMDTTSSPNDGTTGVDNRPYMAVFFIVAVVFCNFLVFNIITGILISFYTRGKRHHDGSELLSPGQQQYVKTKHLIESLLTYDDLMPLENRHAIRIDTFIQSRTFKGMVGPSPWQSSQFLNLEVPHQSSPPVLSTTVKQMDGGLLEVEPTPTARQGTASRFFRRKKRGDKSAVLVGVELAEVVSNPLVARQDTAVEDHTARSPVSKRRRRKAFDGGGTAEATTVVISEADTRADTTTSGLGFSTSIRDRDPDAVPVFENIMYIITLINSGFIMSCHRDMPDVWFQMIYVANGIGLLALIAELGIKIAAYGLSQYISVGWHQIDVIVILVSLSQYPVEAYLGFGAVAYFPVVRLLRLARRRRVMRLLDVARRSFESFVNVLALLVLVYMVYSVAGVILFGKVKRNGALSDETNFDNVPNALLLLFQTSTTVGWDAQMTAAGISEPDCSEVLGNCGSVSQATAFYVTFMLFLTFTVMQLFVAVIVKVFVEQIDPSDPSVSPLFELQHQWASIVGAGVPSIKADEFVRLVPQLSPQLTGIDRRNYYFGVGTGVRGELMRMLATLHIPVDSKLRVRYKDVVQAFGWRMHNIELRAGSGAYGAPRTSGSGFRQPTRNLPPQYNRSMSTIFGGSSWYTALSTQTFLVADHHAAVVIQRRWRAFQLLSDRQHMAILRHPKRAKRLGTGGKGVRKKPALSHYYVNASGAAGLKLDMEVGEMGGGGDDTNPFFGAAYGGGDTADPFADVGLPNSPSPTNSPQTTAKGLRSGMQAASASRSVGQVPHGTLRIPGTSLLAFEAHTLIQPPPGHQSPHT